MASCDVQNHQNTTYAMLEFCLLLALSMEHFATNPAQQQSVKECFQKATWQQIPFVAFLWFWRHDTNISANLQFTYWCQRAGIKGAMPHHESGAVWRKDEARPLVGSMVCVSFTALTLLVWWQKDFQPAKTFIPKRSLPAQVEGKSQGSPAK